MPSASRRSNRADVVMQLAQPICSLYVLNIAESESNLPTEPVMADQIVITEKSSQAKDVRAAVGSRYGEILRAEGQKVWTCRR